jgi:hypothetical protein
MALAAVFILFFSMDENGMDLVWMEWSAYFSGLCVGSWMA